MTTRRWGSRRAARGSRSSATSASSTWTRRSTSSPRSGIGDMSGDVFGNGMLLSDKIRLVAAYDHRHVFIDPDPDAAKGFAERKRLFELAGSSWDDYDRAAISEGGGVWQRSAKRIELPEQARAALGIDDAVLAPDRGHPRDPAAPVDVLWNGGIGTVVKASTETDAEALDRSSDAIRVDATELRCRVVAEGGNLGLTQRARIEFAREGGLDQRRLHRQLGRRRLLRPRGQPQGPARPRRAPRRARGRRARRAAGRGHRRRRRARPLRLLPAGPDARPGGARLGDADVRLRGPHGRARGRGPAPARGRVPAHLRGDGRSPALGPRPRAPGAGRAAGLRQAQPHRRAAAVLAARRRLPRGRPARLLPAGRRRAPGPPAQRAPAAPRARGHDRLQPRRQRARARPSSRGWSPSRGPSRPTSCAPTASRATSPAPSSAGPRIERLAGVDRQAQWKLHGGRRRARRGHGALVPGERPRGRPGHRRSPPGARASGGCRRSWPSSAAKPARGAASAGRPSSSSRACPRSWPAPTPTCRRWPTRPTSSPPPGAGALASRTSGRPSRCSRTACGSRGSRSSSTRCRSARGCSAGRCRRCATTSGARGATSPAGALDESPGAPVEDAVEASSRRVPTRCARLAGLARTMAGEGGADLAGLTLAVRQLRALAS